MFLFQEFKAHVGAYLRLGFTRFCLRQNNFNELAYASLMANHFWGHGMIQLFAKEPQWDRGQWMQPSLITSLMIAYSELTANSDLFFTTRWRIRGIHSIHSGLGISLYSYGSILNIHNMQWVTQAESPQLSWAGLSLEGWRWQLSGATHYLRMMPRSQKKKIQYDSIFGQGWKRDSRGAS